MVQYNTVQYNIIQYSEIQYNDAKSKRVGKTVQLVWTNINLWTDTDIHSVLITVGGISPTPELFLECSRDWLVLHNCFFSLSEI